MMVSCVISLLFVCTVFRCVVNTGEVKGDKCVVECAGEDWGDVDDDEFDAVSVGREIMELCKDNNGNVITCKTVKEKADSAVEVASTPKKDVIKAERHKTCRHCKDAEQICIGFPEDDYEEPECLYDIDDEQCAGQCELGENCKHIGENRYNCVPDPKFNICDTCDKDEICLGFPDEGVPYDCYDKDDELPCAAMCEDDQVCEQHTEKEYQCVTDSNISD